MKALVTYFSQTGNTEIVARAIHEALHVRKDIIPIQDLKDAGGYDIIFYGFPVQAHSVPGKAQAIFKLLPEGQKIALFSTHGSLRGGQLPKQAFEHAAGLASKHKILGTFGSRGKVDPHIIEALMQKPEHKAWAEEAMSAEGHPNDADLADAKDFAKKMMSKLA